MSSFWSLSLKDFRDQLASGSPTPGGGAAAMVAASLGAALVSMAVAVSIKKEGHDARLDELAARLKGTIDELSGAADEDSLAFEGYMEARRGGGDMEAALRRSADAPVSGLRHIVEALQVAEEAAPLVLKSIISDVGCGASLLAAAAEAALLTADMNLAAMKDLPEAEAAYAAELKALGEQTMLLKDAARKAVLGRI